MTTLLQEKVVSIQSQSGLRKGHSRECYHCVSLEFLQNSHNQFYTYYLSILDLSGIC